jgi:hypothetical protein
MAKKKVPQRKVTVPSIDKEWLKKYISSVESSFGEDPRAINPNAKYIGKYQTGFETSPTYAKALMKITKAKTLEEAKKLYVNDERIQDKVFELVQLPEYNRMDKLYGKEVAKQFPDFSKEERFGLYHQTGDNEKFRASLKAGILAEWKDGNGTTPTAYREMARSKGVTRPGTPATTTQPAPQAQRSLPTSPSVNTPLNKQGLPDYTRQSVNGEVDPLWINKIDPRVTGAASTTPKPVAPPVKPMQNQSLRLPEPATTFNTPIPQQPIISGNEMYGVKPQTIVKDDRYSPQTPFGDTVVNPTTPTTPTATKQTPQLPPYRTSGVPYLSNVLNSFRQPAAVPSPIYENQIQLERQNMDNDRNEVRRGMNTTFRSLDNSMDAQTAGLLKLGALGQSVNQLSSINQNERNTNIGIANQEATINRQVASSNANRQATFNAEQAARKNAMTSAQSENIANAVGKYMGMQDQKNAYNMENFKAQLEFGKDEYGTLKRSSIIDEQFKKYKEDSKTLSETFLDKLKAKKPGELVEKKWGGYTAGRMIKRMNLKPII